MQHIIIIKDVEIPNCPKFFATQKVRVSNTIADLLVERDFAKYDIGEKSVTVKAKHEKTAKEQRSKQSYDGTQKISKNDGLKDTK